MYECLTVMLVYYTVQLGCVGELWRYDLLHSTNKLASMLYNTYVYL